LYIVYLISLVVRELNEFVISLAGRFNREYRAAQFRGLPFPILWIAEYFTFDGEGIRWGRHYRQAGWYAHICMWWVLHSYFLLVLSHKSFLVWITLNVKGG